MEKITTNDPFGNQMVAIKGGTFWMGSPDDEADRGDNEYRHQVTVSSFKMGKYEVTQAQWEAVMGDNPSLFKDGPECPVHTVSWNDVQKFLERLNAKTGKSYRLPTEAEWEYAARGGNKSKGYQYAGSNNIDEVAWYNGNSGLRTHPVGQKRPNGYGLYDMTGNVEEWCSDWFGWHYYNNSPANNPTGPVTGAFHVVRGGSWIYNAQFCRLAYRDSNIPDHRSSFIGFRLAHSIEQNPIDMLNTYLNIAPLAIRGLLQ